jgi:NitT/TauT family transport system substrate-binding protein
MKRQTRGAPRVATAAVCALIAFVFCGTAAGEATEVRIGRQLGVGYLQVYVMQEQKLLEKHAKEEGIDGLDVTYQPIGSPALLNDGLLAGKLDIVVAGPTSFLVLWDRTRNSGNPVKMIAGLSEHPDAVTALLSGSVITAHFASIPFYDQELAHGGTHKVTSSYDILGGPATLFCLWGTSRFRTENPKIIRALWKALTDATDFIRQHPAEAAEIYIKLDHSKFSVDAIAKILTDPQVVYSLTPTNIMPIADYMAKLGMLHNKPGSWKELVFPEAHSLPGS